MTTQIRKVQFAINFCCGMMDNDIKCLKDNSQVLQLELLSEFASVSDVSEVYKFEKEKNS